MSSDPDRERAGMALCRRCGLCCDGTIFSRVPLTGGEAERLERRGLPVDRREGSAPALLQRCGALAGRDCQIYEDRPAPCRTFRCHQLIALWEGEVSDTEALAVVERARAEVDSLARLLGATSAGAVVEARRRIAAGEAAEEVRGQLARIDALVRAHFTGRAGR